ncbi:unnamed protein product [Mycena citricolor]|uniref:Phospholipid:diacylglycerol acyltransferase n=1 Tax=Mycena citricolor TaxID=2018698 RepID=A0AAD2HVE7_9AGAR|nr:unnamed protein product [Mycena citricolor]
MVPFRKIDARSSSQRNDTGCGVCVLLRGRSRLFGRWKAGRLCGTRPRYHDCRFRRYFGYESGGYCDRREGGIRFHPLLDRRTVAARLCCPEVAVHTYTTCGHAHQMRVAMPFRRTYLQLTSMALVKRAKFKSSDSDDSHGQTDDTNEDSVETASALHAEKKKHKKSRPIIAYKRFLFPLGLITGALIAFSLIEPRDIQDLHAHLTLLLGEYDLALPNIPGLDLSALETEWQRLRSNIPEVWKLSTDGREFQVGEAMKERKLTAQFPVVLIPGIISTSLESWSTEPEYRPFFRQKMWGGFSMLSQVTFNRDKWINAMLLDPVTGLDPPGAKVRAAEGIDAASMFIQGYWIWSKIVENLAVVNYDTNNLYLAPYDWRLSFSNLEERDGYFSRIKTTIESFKRRQGKKTVIAAHSMGCSVCVAGMWLPSYLDGELSHTSICSSVYLLFAPLRDIDNQFSFKWVESPAHGAGGPTWVEDHVESYIAISGTHLGVAKAMTAFLSGEMKDTVQMNPAGAYALERFFSRAERQKLFRSWAGSASMWVKGGDAIWGGPDGAPDDEVNCTMTHGELIAFRVQPPPPGVASSGLGVDEGDRKNMTVDTAGSWILQHTPSSFQVLRCAPRVVTWQLIIGQKMMATNFSVGIERDEEVLRKNNEDPTKWSNPLEVQLPLAPSMKVYCVYGHGKRSYWYTQAPNEYDEAAENAFGSQPLCVDVGGEACQANTGLPVEAPLIRKSWIDAEYNDENVTPKIRNGVMMGEGDGTVNLISLGAMCVEGWKRPRWNPAGIKVTTVELPHQPVLNMPRGGANTSDHVDILGSTGLNEIILKVATGVGHEIEERFVSNIKEYTSRMRWDAD